MALEDHLASPLAHAIRIAGSQSAFGRLISRPQSTVHDWLKNDKPLPAEYVLTVERETGISRHQLRPDLYPQEPLHPSPVADAPGVAIEAPGVVCNRGGAFHRKGDNDA